MGVMVQALSLSLSLPLAVCGPTCEALEASSLVKRRMTGLRALQKLTNQHLFVFLFLKCSKHHLASSTVLVLDLVLLFYYSPGSGSTSLVLKTCGSGVAGDTRLTAAAWRQLKKTIFGTDRGRSLRFPEGLPLTPKTVHETPNRSLFNLANPLDCAWATEGSHWCDNSLCLIHQERHLDKPWLRALLLGGNIHLNITRCAAYLGCIPASQPQSAKHCKA